MIGPVPSMNMVSTAMAQGYDNYSDNYSYGQDMYSENPTDENKYECQTGPFEGFFVSSVEFCKFKFDDKDRKDDRDRDDNRTGTQGPPGPQGETGSTGPQGPQGPQGPPGTGTGTIGPVGPQGPQGIQGLPGSTGATGAQGLQGLRGFNGTDGEDGAAGLQGPRGFNGTDGEDGAAGLQGPRGFNGTDGAQGPRGFNGTDGAQGPRGFNGTDGNATANAQLQCEECIKYWSHGLSVDGFRDFIHDLTEAINSINFDYLPNPSPTDDPTPAFPGQSTPTCTEPSNNPLVTGDNPAATCLPQPPSDREDLLAQVFELCVQFERAIDWLANSNPPTAPRTIPQAFEAFATQFINTLGGANCTNTDCKIARGLLDCLRVAVIPLLVAERAQMQQIISQNQVSGMQMTQNSDLNALLQHPNVKALLQNPDLNALLQNPDENALLKDPNVKALLEDPEVNALLEDPEVKALLEEPTVKAQLQNPTISAPTGIVP